MSEEPEDVQESMARVRRGCLGVAAIFLALTLLSVTASEGNLFYLIFLVGTIISLLLWRYTR
ncbi:hypothetical protein K2Z83_08420 [Oscillochloris sp. ZM17-4]|uniref:hypothetical protein n=1 Tax=Oscillochloris sp. ZM17-4 TaxID=2866714 RepID=UPI001C732835|nr:hypothetical protein [Oscillochloris sp. ZM17-4]MBX0327701.1 hypothetical protein [Oscillochloris sp. ZM17-4]